MQACQVAASRSKNEFASLLLPQHSFEKNLKLFLIRPLHVLETTELRTNHLSYLGPTFSLILCNFLEHIISTFLMVCESSMAYGCMLRRHQNAEKCALQCISACQSCTRAGRLPWIIKLAHFSQSGLITPLRAVSLEGKKDVNFQSRLFGLQVRPGVHAFALTKRFGFRGADTALAGGEEVNGRPCSGTLTFDSHLPTHQRPQTRSQRKNFLFTIFSVLFSSLTHSLRVA